MTEANIFEVEAFTIDRCVWASDWPHLRASARVDYGVPLQVMLRLFPSLEDRRRILWRTPRMLFGFGDDLSGT